MRSLVFVWPCALLFWAEDDPKYTAGAPLFLGIGIALANRCRRAVPGVHGTHEALRTVSLLK